MVKIKFKRLPGNEDIPLPKYQTDAAAAMDLHAAVKETTVLNHMDRKLVPTGFQLEFPKGYVVQLVPRSGMALKHGLSLPNSPATIDADYRGELGVILINLGKEPIEIKRGDRICQMLLKKYEHAEIIEVDELSDTARGEGGFGSTGK